MNPDAPPLPGWLVERPWRDQPAPSATDDFEVSCRRSDQLLLASVRARGARDLAAECFAERTAAAYRLLFAAIDDAAGWHPVRLWNFVPDILGALGPEPHRYWRFNAGRFAAFAARCGGHSAFPVLLPTASATGHQGRDLVILCLAARFPGTPVENPRQVPAYRYSKRYGALPPCFARATLLAVPPGRRTLLIGGTASVRGEDSVHPGDLEAQACETAANLGALVTAAAPIHEQPLSRLRSLRAYVKPPCAPALVERPLRSLLGRDLPIEWVACDLCRPELLLEVEGVAEV